MEDRIVGTLPDLFGGFLVEEPRVNDGYQAAKIESEDWLTSTCNFEPSMRKKVNACDFSWFMSIATPDAPADRLKTVCDWGNWVFPFDDMFDSGDLRNDLPTSQRVLESLMANMLDKPFPGRKLPVVKAHDDIYRRFCEGSSTGTQRRFARAMQHYTAGVANHVEQFTTNHIPTLQEMLETRQLSVGVAPIYHLIEYAHGIELPDEVFEHPVIQTLQNLGADFVILSNDILSYRKEESEDCPFNMTAACRLSGQSAQEAFDTIGSMIEQRYLQWDQAMSNLPSWCIEVDTNVRRYIEGIQNVVQANISWSFRSKRYLGEQGLEVRRTRKIDVMAHPPYLEKLGIRGSTTEERSITEIAKQAMPPNITLSMASSHAIQVGTAKIDVSTKSSLQYKESIFSLSTFMYFLLSLLITSVLVSSIPRYVFVAHSWWIECK